MKCLQQEHRQLLAQLEQLNSSLVDLKNKPALQIDSIMQLERGDLNDTSILRAYRNIYAQNVTNFWSLVAHNRIELLEYKLCRRQIIGSWQLENMTA